MKHPLFACLLFTMLCSAAYARHDFAFIGGYPSLGMKADFPKSIAFSIHIERRFSRFGISLFGADLLNKDFDSDAEGFNLALIGGLRFNCYVIQTERIDLYGGPLVEAVWAEYSPSSRGIKFGGQAGVNLWASRVFGFKAEFCYGIALCNFGIMLRNR